MDGKQLLDKVSSIKGSNGDIGTQKNRAMIDGALIGMAAGIFYGFAKKQNMIMMGMLGAVGGALVSRLLMPSS